MSDVELNEVKVAKPKSDVQITKPIPINEYYKLIFDLDELWNLKGSNQQKGNKKLEKIEKLKRKYSNILNENIPSFIELEKREKESNEEYKINQQDVTAESNTNTKNISKFKQNIIDEIIWNALKIENLENVDTVFFKSAVSELCRDDLSEDIIKQCKSSYTVLTFMLKYGNIKNPKFGNNAELLIDKGVDVNKFDSKGNTAIFYISLLHKNNQQDPKSVDVLKQIASKLLQKKVLKVDKPMVKDFLSKEMAITEENYEFMNFEELDSLSKLFYWTSNDKPMEFLSHKKLIDNPDGDNGEFTLLQMAATRRSDSFYSVVQYLLRNNADPNKITEFNTSTPLELAAIYNNSKIFKEILDHKETTINNAMFNNFVKMRSLAMMKLSLFEQLLESKKIDPKFTYESTNNTPLHYAINYTFKKAIQKLLKNSSLLTQNQKGRSPLDTIDPQDLETFFDSCLVLDNYTSYFTDVSYKMQLRFNSLIEENSYSEISVLTKLSKCSNLNFLLTHTLIQVFIALKWYRAKFYFWIFFFIQLILFLLLATYFYFYPKLSSEYLAIGIPLVLVNMLKIFAIFRWKNKKFSAYAFNQVKIHATFELLLMITTSGAFFQNQFRAFLFVEIAICFLLTGGYHPQLSKWSIMLQEVFKTFTVLLIFFSFIIIGFGIGFHILFPADSLFEGFYTSIFRTYIMITGEFNIGNDTGFQNSGFGGYLMFFLLAMFMSLVIVNFWIGVAVTDIERIERNSEINALKNVIIFMAFIDKLYTMSCLSKIKACIRSPLLFFQENFKTCRNGSSYEKVNTDDATNNKTEKYTVDFYVNRNRQFDDKKFKNFPQNLDDECFDKVRNYYYRQTAKSKEDEILQKLNDVLKFCQALSNKAATTKCDSCKVSESNDQKDKTAKPNAGKSQKKQFCKKGG